MDKKNNKLLRPWFYLSGVSTVASTCLPVLFFLDLLVWAVSGHFLLWRAEHWGPQVLVVALCLAISLTDELYPRTVATAKYLVWRLRAKVAEADLEYATQVNDQLLGELESQRLAAALNNK